MQTPVTGKVLTIYLFTALLIFHVSPINMCQAKCRQDVGLTEEHDQRNTEEKADVRIFTHEDCSKEFKIGIEEEFQVRLSENPTTGFLWTILDSSSPNIELVDKRFSRREDSPMIGAGGIRIFIFRSLKAGHAVLHLVLKRPWEKEDEYTDTCSLKFLIE